MSEMIERIQDFWTKITYPIQDQPKLILRLVDAYESLLSQNKVFVDLATEFKRCKRWIAGDGLCCACAERYFEALNSLPREAPRKEEK